MSSPYIQIIFAVETTEKAKTDYFYIREVLNKYFDIGNNKTSFVYMCGKHNYCNVKIAKKIKTLIKEYSITSGKSYVVYVCDKDKNMSVPQDSKFIEDLEEYCFINGYELIWFVTTIEEVLWGSKISDKEKITKSKQFVKQKRINDVNRLNLSASSNVNSKKMSNILTVLSNFPEIKRNN